MRSDKIQDAIGMIDEDLLEKSEQAKPKKHKALIKWTVPIAAALALALAIGIIFGGGSPFGVVAEAALYKAEYPDRPQHTDDYTESSAWDAWLDGERERRSHYGKGDSLTPFFTESISTILSNQGTENAIYSPLNVYFALTMLAEVTGGNTRQELLTLLGAESMDALREQANHLWLANYQNDGRTTSILANSIWMNERLDYNKDTLLTLAAQHRASSYSGDIDSPEMTAALHDWINEQTGGMLTEQVKEISFDAETIFALVSTILYKASWTEKFSESQSTEEIFHAASGDETATFFHSFETDSIFYDGEKFTATNKPLMDGAQMYFMLPDEGVSIDELLCDRDALSFLAAPKKYENRAYYWIDLTIPKFDVNSKLDLIDSMVKMGVSDVFTPGAADFSPLLSEGAAYVSMIEHAARVKIDENGVEAAAYTLIVSIETAAQTPPKRIDFTADRPFLFVVTGGDGTPLFVGIVNTVNS